MIEAFAAFAGEEDLWRPARVHRDHHKAPAIISEGERVNADPSVEAGSDRRDDGLIAAHAGSGNRIQCGLTAAELIRFLRDRFALLASVERRVANVRVRNVGTLGGNLCFAEPHSDPGTALLLYDASVEVAGPSGRRSIAVEALASGPYETALADDELLTRIDVPELPA
ncbi:MAG: FAD binding domain-containing protein, partial [Chloroflexi bacterium]|nr:FAD binding domain-containing protein [Chloroflexota bacterium]